MEMLNLSQSSLTCYVNRLDFRLDVTNDVTRFFLILVQAQLCLSFFVTPVCLGYIRLIVSKFIDNLLFVHFVSD